MAFELPSTCVAYEDFLERARRVLPSPVFAYLQGGIGGERGLARNRADLDAVLLTPRLNGLKISADPSVSVLGKTWSFPFGIAPVGIPGLFCPGAEKALAAAASQIDIPLTLSTVASATIEDVAAAFASPLWFQLYPVRSDEIRHDLIRRAAAAGCGVLMVTADVPVPQRRERTMRVGLSFPVRLGPLVRAMPASPRWVIRMLRGPRPVVANLKPYAQRLSEPEFLQMVHQQTHQPLGVDEIAEIREAWPGRLVVKGVLDPRSAAELEAIGVDGLVVSNHGGRQLDASPTPVQALPRIRQAVSGRVALFADSGATSGLDILRLLSLGADMVLLGRYPYTALAAYGPAAALAALNIICDQITGVMMQLGVRTVGELSELQKEVLYPNAYGNRGS